MSLPISLLIWQAAGPNLAKLLEFDSLYGIL